VRAVHQQNTATGAGGFCSAFNAEVLKNNIRLITTNFWSDGEGRYLFGQAPDLIVNANGSLSARHSGGTIDGVEATIKNTLLYAYYGGIYIGRDVGDRHQRHHPRSDMATTGSANSQNRVINEITFGFNQTMWRNPRYGAINVHGSVRVAGTRSVVQRSGAPKGTHDNTIYMDVRYTLPGGMPNF
jgi:hypothetical protein